jgi:hypothetical protein
MVDREDLLELVPHYVAMIVLVLVVMSIVRAVIGDQHVLVEFGIILVLVFGYRPVVMRLDFVPTPEIWETFEQ